jgi:cytochrome c2
MKKLLFATIFFSLFVVTDSSATVYKGQMVFSKNCVVCHTNAQEFIESKTKVQWKKAIGENGIGLVKIHLKSQKAKNSWKYFYSKKYTKKVKHLRDFLVEYAKDSGRIPVCK